MAAPHGNHEVMALLADPGPNDGLIDVGANISLTTSFAGAKSAGALSLEPTAREFVDLLHNCAMSSI